MLLDLREMADSLFAAPALVDIEHEGGARAVAAEHLAGDLEAADVAIQIQAALDLGGAESALGPLGVMGGEGVVVQAEA
ncbi:hypothetical protein D3C73_1186200 [compost metagenome]